MADKARLEGLVKELNSALGDVTPYKLAVSPPGDLKPIDKNAHYMPKRVYDQLAKNIETDGNLSSLPFCWKDGDSFVVLSGNHRVQAAVAARVSLILFLYTDEHLTRAQQRAIQLSHNSLVGQDNPTILKDLWTEIDDLGAKIYSGLDEELLKVMDTPELERITDEPLRFEELRILFVPAEIDRVTEMLKRLGSVHKVRLAAKYEDFDRFFDALLDFKEAAGIVNTGTAIMVLTEIAEKWIVEQDNDNGS